MSSFLPVDPQGLTPELDLLTIPETARLARTSVIHIRRMIQRGVLPAYRFGGRKILIRRRDLIARIEAGAISPAPAR